MPPLDLMAITSIAMRALHILSAILLLGGVMALKAGASDHSIAAWRKTALTAMIGLVVAGLYNFLQKTGLTPAYHALFGIKILLALHVFAVTLIATKSGPNPKRTRQLTGVAISGIAIVLLSAVLRWITLQ